MTSLPTRTSSSVSSSTRAASKRCAATHTPPPAAAPPGLSGWPAPVCPPTRRPAAAFPCLPLSFRGRARRPSHERALCRAATGHTIDPPPAPSPHLPLSLCVYVRSSRRWVSWSRSAMRYTPRMAAIPWYLSRASAMQKWSPPICATTPVSAPWRCTATLPRCAEIRTQPRHACSARARAETRARTHAHIARARAHLDPPARD